MNHQGLDGEEPDFSGRTIKKNLFTYVSQTWPAVDEEGETTGSRCYTSRQTQKVADPRHLYIVYMVYI